MEEEQSKIDESTERKRFSDTYGQPEFDFPGDQVEEKEVRDKEMTIWDFVLLNGSFGEFAVVDAELTEATNIEITEETNGEPTTTTKEVKRIQFPEGSDVIRRQLKKAKEDGNLPIVAKIAEKKSKGTKMTYRTLC